MRKYLAVFILAVGLVFITTQAALAQTGNQTYYVVQGDTLESIAARFGVTSASIMRQNGILNPDMIYVGQALSIPNLGNNMGNSNSSGYYNTGCANYHVVRIGETLSSIAWNYGTSVQALMQQNNLHNQDVVYAGQRLCVSAGNRGQMQPAAYQNNSQGAMPASYYHTVSQGENLSGICERYGVNMWDVVRANNMSNASFIQPGQQIAIPGYQPQPAAYGNNTAPYSGPAYNPEPPSQGKPTPPRQDKKPSQGSRPEAKPQRPSKPNVHLRLGRNVVYEYWGRPEYGLDDCHANWYDDGKPVKRLTAEVLVTNKSKKTIPKDWADAIFHMQSGAKRHACIHRYNEYDMPHKDEESKKYNPGSDFHFPGAIEAYETVDVTFYTHLEKNDLVLEMEFPELGICLDPNSGDRIDCKMKW